MEPAAGRLPLQVLGENEALQQFFSGETPGKLLEGLGCSFLRGV